MSEQDDQNRTEDPTPRRRELARREGQIVFSSDLTAGLVLLLLAGLLPWLANRWLQEFPALLQPGLTVSQHPWTVETAWLLMQWLLTRVLIYGGPICGLIWLGSLISAQGQMGPLHWRELKFTPEKIVSPENWKRMFSGENARQGLFALVKLGVALVIGWSVVATRLPWRRDATGPTEVGFEIPAALALWLAAAALGWGVLDYFFKWRRQEARLKMTREELKRELREDSGDPNIKHRRRQLHRDALQRRSLEAVPAASLVVRNPTHYAVALRYEPGQAGAPKVIAKGQGVLARRIMALAEQHGVPVLERKPLARALYFLVEVDQEIPAEFFQAVAEVLAYVYRLRRR